MANPTETKPQRHAIRARVIVIACAAVAALLIWMVSAFVMGIQLVTGSGPAAQRIGPVAVALTAVVCGALAWAVRALCERIVRRPQVLWHILGWLVLGLTLLGPVSMAQSWQVLITLLIMHLVVGACLIVGFDRTSRRAPSVSYREPAKAVDTR